MSSLGRTIPVPVPFPTPLEPAQASPGLGEESIAGATPVRWIAEVNSEKITTTNPQWGGRADLRIGGRSSDLLIGNQMPLALGITQKETRRTLTALPIPFPVTSS